MTTAAGAIDAKREVAPTDAPNISAKSNRAKWIMGAIAAAAAIGGTSWYVTHKGLETTDDAQVDADVVAIPARTSGVVSKVLFVENQPVKAGDVLAELDSEPAKARLAEADANLVAAKASADAADADERVTESNVRGNKSVAEASLLGATSGASATKDQITEGEAQLASATTAFQKAQTDFTRAKQLLASGSISQAQLDQDQAAFDTANAALAQAKAHLSTLRASTSQAWSHVQEANARLRQSSDVDVLIAQARARAQASHAQVATLQAARDLALLDLSYTKIVAPQDGVVSRKSIGVGQMLVAGTPIVQLVPLAQVWVNGNFKETQVSKMRVGQPVRVSVDAYPGVEIDGEVESFSAGTGARFALLPPDNATGNYTKVVQRLPVRVRLKSLPPDIALRPGMSADLTVDTRR